MIKGCIEYNSDGKCSKCEEEYEKKDGGTTCQFEGCKKGTLYQYCGICKSGYMLDEDGEDGKCIGYDGSKDTSSSTRIKVEYASVVFALALLI